MSKLSRKFKVPDRLANLYDFANSLDVRRFTHYGVPHMQSDELASPRELGVWMSQPELNQSASFDDAHAVLGSHNENLESRVP